MRGLINKYGKTLSGNFKKIPEFNDRKSPCKVTFVENNDFGSYKYKETTEVSFDRLKETINFEEPSKNRPWINKFIFLKVYSIHFQVYQNYYQFQSNLVDS